VPRDMIGEGDGQSLRDIHSQAAVSTLSPVRKRGRPRRAREPVLPTAQLPTGAPIEETPQETAVGGGHQRYDSQSPVVSPTPTAIKVPNLSPLIDELISLQRERLFMIRTKNRMMNSTVAYVRRFLDWKPDMTEAERSKINAKALSIVQKVEKGVSPSDDERYVTIKCQHLILAAQKARAPFENSLTAAMIEMPDGTIGPGIERQMEKLAKKLPVWSWASEVKGFGPLSLAVIIAETGDLSNYSNPGKVWKRMGVAPYKGKAAKTWRSSGGLTAQEWVDFGYKPARRSELYQRQDPLLKHQIRKVKDEEGNDTGERIAGPYGKVYLDRKKYELDRDPNMSKMWAHNRAARYMEKRLLKHLWQAWRRQPLED
jgi:hypothetical protein